MKTTKPMELLFDGNITNAAYKVYDQAFAFGGASGYPIGIMFLVFQILHILKTQNIGFNFVTSLIIFSVLLYFGLLPKVMIGLITTVLIMELTGVVYITIMK